MKNTKNRVLGILENLLASKPINYESKKEEVVEEVKPKKPFKPIGKVSNGVGVGK